MIKLLLGIICIFITEASIAQISGKVTASDGQPVPFANAVLYSAKDSSITKASVTNDKGAYSIGQVGTGVYFLRISCIGYQKWVSPLITIGSGDTAIEMGNQALTKDSRQLSSVVVRAQKPLYEQKMEGMVVNVEGSILSKGSSAVDILERSPGVVIDRRNGTISLNGKSGVTVLINGKSVRMSGEQLLDLLGGMTADNIERVELLTTPSAKYDAEGSAGMINIVLKKNRKQGTNGTLSITAGYGWGEKAGTNLSISHNKGKVNLYGAYSFSHDRSYAVFESQGSEYAPALGGQTDFATSSIIKPLNDKHNANAGIDISLSPALTIGGSVIYNNSVADVKAYNNGDYNLQPDSLLQLNSVSRNINKWRNVLTSIYIDKKLKGGQQVGMSVDYLRFSNNNPTDVTSSTLDKNGNDVSAINDSLFSPYHRGLANTLIHVWIGKADYSKNISKKTRLEAGVKGSVTRSHSVSGIASLINGNWVEYGNRSSDMKMKEGIAAAYASMDSKLSPSTNLVVGIRYEYSRTYDDKTKDGDHLVDRRLGKIFPDVFLSHKVNDNSTLQLSYTQRISRPSYNDLASYVAYNDPISVFTGNPILKPTITNNVKVWYNYKNYSFSMLLSRDDHPIAQAQIVHGPDTSLLYISPRNLGYQNNLTFQANIPVKLAEWWNMNYNFVGGWRQVKVEHTPTPAEKTYFAYSFNFSEIFKLPRQFSIELSGWYNSTSYYGNSRIGDFGVVNLGIKKELKNKGGTFDLSVSDVFRTMRMHNSFGAFTQEAFDLNSRVKFYTESSKATVVRLTYSKSFGGTSSQRKHQSNSDEIRGRVNQ